MPSPTVVSLTATERRWPYRPGVAPSSPRFLVVLLLLGCAGSFATFAPAAAAARDRSNCLTAGSSRPPPDWAPTARCVSRADYAAKAGWHTIRRMPATVLEVLQDDGTYPDLYYGKNLLDEVPQDLYKQDWWYRTSFTAPAGHSTYLLELPGINYRAEVWLNGRLVADNTQIVGMHNAHELDVGALAAARRTEHPRHQGDAGAGAAGHRRGGARRQLVGLDQLELPGIPGPGQEPRPRQFVCLRPQCGYLEAGLSQGRGRGGARAGRRQHRIAAAANRFRPADRSHDRAQLLARTASRRTQGQDHAAQASRASTSSRRSRLLPGEQREVTFSPDEFDDADRRQPRPVVALHPRRAEPLRPAAGVQPVRAGVGFLRSPVRHPHRLPAPRRRRRLPRSGQGRQLLSDRQRPGSSGARRGLHARSAVRLRPRSARTRSCATSRISASTCCGWRASSRASTSSRRPTNSASR